MTNIMFKSVACSLCILNTLSSVSPSSMRNPRPTFFSKVMKAIRINEFGGPSVLKLEKIQIPSPSEDQVLIKVKAAGINPVDIYVRQKAFGFIPPLPFTIGKEASGFITEVGSNVDKFEEDDRVICCLPYDGGYAEYIVCNASNLIPLGQKLSYSQGAAIYVAYFTAYRSLVSKCNMKKGEVALVHGGSGAVGVAAIQLAKSRGLKVVGTAGTPEGLRIVRQIGADIVVNHREKGHLQKALAEAGSTGFDVILENKACTNLRDDIASLRQGGRIAIVGSGGPIDLNPRQLISNEGRIYGIKMTAVTQEDFKEYSEALVKGMNDGWVKPVIAKEYTLEQVQQAHEDMMNKDGARGKLVLVMHH